MGSYYKLLEQKTLAEVPFIEYIYGIYHSGSCQCFKDCDCYLLKGKLITEDKKYSHPLKNKKFNSFDSCYKSYTDIIKNQLNE